MFGSHLSIAGGMHIALHSSRIHDINHATFDTAKMTKIYCDVCRLTNRKAESFNPSPSPGTPGEGRGEGVLNASSGADQ